MMFPGVAQRLGGGLSGVCFRILSLISQKIVVIGLAAQSARRQPKTIAILAKRRGGGRKPSFRGDAKHRTRNLEIPRCAIAHLRSGPADHPGMTRALRRPDVGEDPVDLPKLAVGLTAERARPNPHP